jgi:hypothetical protein
MYSQTSLNHVFRVPASLSQLLRSQVRACLERVRNVHFSDRGVNRLRRLYRDPGSESPGDSVMAPAARKTVLADFSEVHISNSPHSTPFAA